MRTSWHVHVADFHKQASILLLLLLLFICTVCTNQLPFAHLSTSRSPIRSSCAGCGGDKNPRLWRAREQRGAPQSWMDSMRLVRFLPFDTYAVFKSHSPMRQHPSRSCPAHYTAPHKPFPFRAQYVSTRRWLLLWPHAARAVRTDRRGDRAVGVAESRSSQKYGVVEPRRNCAKSFKTHVVIVHENKP